MSSISQRSAKIRERADIFKEQDYLRTGQSLYELAEAVDAGRTGDRVAELERVLRIFREEWGKGDSDFLALYDFIERTVFDSRNKLGRKLGELQTQVSEMNKAASVMADVARVFLRTGGKKERYYGACVEHMMDVEGQFDEACRILYVLYSASGSESAHAYDVEDMLLSDLRQKLRTVSRGKSEILFQGYENGHLRNAIADMRIEYDDATDKMHFIDKKMKHKMWQETYNEKLTSQQFLRHFWLTKGVSFVFLRIWLILGASYLACASDAV